MKSPLESAMERPMSDRAGRLVSQGSTVYDLNLPKPDASWTWHIAPLKEESRFLSKDLIVGAWHFPPCKDPASNAR